MVRFFFLLFFYAFLLFDSVSIVLAKDNEPQLKVSTDTSQIEMGKFLSVSIIYIGETVPENVNLKSWDEDFFVDIRDSETEDLINGLIQHTQFIRLYPRSVGSKVLSSIAWGGAIAAPIRIKVEAAIRNKIDVTPYWLALPKVIWQGQRIKVSIIQNLLHASNKVAIENVEFTGFTVKQLKQEKITKNNHKQIKLSWLITPQYEGVFQLKLPAITQRGRGRWRFYLPHQQIIVNPLPSYIPPTIPVGKLSITSGIFFKESQPFWFIEIKNQGKLPDDIYSLRTQLSKLTGVAIESIETIPMLGTLSLYSKPLSHGYSSLVSSIRYQIPMPSWTQALISMSKVTIPYFDVINGNIQVVSNRLPSFWNIPKLVFYSFYILLTLILCYVFFMIFNKVKKLLLLKNSRLLIKQTNQPEELRKLILSYGDFLTLEQWALAVGNNFKKASEVKEIASDLNRLCYDKSKPVDSLLFNKVRKLILTIY